MTRAALDNDRRGASTETLGISKPHLVASFPGGKLASIKASTLRRANLIGIGASRTATSSLARMLRATQEVFVPEEKEINGFGIDADITEPAYDERFAEAAVDHRHLADIRPSISPTSRLLSE